MKEQMYEEKGKRKMATEKSRASEYKLLKVAGTSGMWSFQLQNLQK